MKILDRPVYYMGNGFFISYTERQFKVENSARIEFGEVGEYALGAYCFTKKNEFYKHFKISNERLHIEDDFLEGNLNINDEIHIGDTINSIRNTLRQKMQDIYYSEGETRTLINSKFYFVYNWIIWKSYTLYFYGKSKKTPLTSFKYTFE